MATVVTGVPESSAVRTVLLVAKVAGLKDVSLKADAGAVVPVLAHAKMTVNGVNTIAQFLAQQAGAKHLVGSTPEEEAQIAEYFTKCSMEYSTGSSTALSALNESLKATATLVGSRITLADITVFGALFDAVSKLKPGEKRGLVNLLRWFDFVQNVIGAKEIFGEEVSIEKKDFVPPPPPEVAKPGPPGAADKGKDAKGQPAADKGGKGAPAPAAAAAAAAVAAPAEPKGEKKGKGEGKPAEQKGEGAPAGSGGGEGKKGKGEGKAKGEGKPKEAEKAPAAKGEITVQALDIRVGTIVKVWPHPDADGLWVEEIDLGEAKPRQVVSGLRKFVPEERMLGANVLVVVNVKPGNLRDVRSEGLVLCASNADHTEVDFVIPPKGVPNGEKVAFPGFEGPARPALRRMPQGMREGARFLCGVLCGGSRGRSAQQHCVPPPRAHVPGFPSHPFRSCPLCPRYSASRPAQPDERLDSKKKQLEAVFPHLATDAEGVAKYKEVPFTTSQGLCTARLKSSHIK